MAPALPGSGALRRTNSYERTSMTKVIVAVLLLVVAVVVGRRLMDVFDVHTPFGRGRSTAGEHHDQRQAPMSPPTLPPMPTPQPTPRPPTPQPTPRPTLSPADRDAVLAARKASANAEADVRPESVLRVCRETIAVLKFDDSGRTVVLKLLPEHAPRHVAQFLRLVREGYYAQSTFYRLVKGFVLQGTGDQANDDKYHIERLPLEYSMPNDGFFVNMARTSDPNSATTHFSIHLGENAKHLAPGGADEYGYTVWARVIAGTTTLRSIQKKSKVDGETLTPPLHFSIELQVQALDENGVFARDAWANRPHDNCPPPL